MSRIEFYVLSSSSQSERMLAACKLALKGWRARMPVFVRCQDEAQARELDELLWRFKADAFIPHDLHASDPQAPVVIGLDDEPASRQGLLINLQPDISPHVGHFSRVIEIVNQDPPLLAACRKNFRLYRERGYDPQRVEL
ncbi:DNA polymerase III subunit chi [Zestomonas carbonaria]|uniref:DNA polymerase III subunit chi n=1 Tax=Zestomonas carbonaria TaxID=2762745 RepID=A0A7U7EN38_9GAMM|nr:DNA polymerase III subunit chi [Pseudomonas carbonaria]CAD5108019.1 DNA polymerase III subunit chi [Pseudomonas carbonaria]